MFHFILPLVVLMALLPASAASLTNERLDAVKAAVIVHFGQNWKCEVDTRMAVDDSVGNPAGKRVEGMVMPGLKLVGGVSATDLTFKVGADVTELSTVYILSFESEEKAAAFFAKSIANRTDSRSGRTGHALVRQAESWPQFKARWS